MRHLKRKFKYLNDELKIDKYIVRNDIVDRNEFESIKNVNAKIAKLSNEDANILPTVEGLIQDVYSSLYKYLPEIKPDNEISYTHLINKEIIKNITEAEQYKELRNLTRLDSLAATFGLEVLGPSVKETLREIQKKVDELNKQYSDLEGSGAAESEEGAEESEEGDESGKKSKNSKRYTKEEAKKRLEEYKQEIKELIDKKVQREIKGAVSQAVNEAQTASDMIAQWGLGQSESFTKSSYEDKLKLLERLRNSSKLKEIAELAGRYKHLAIQTQKEKVKRGMDEVYDIQNGSDLDRILPTEKVKLKIPALKKLFKKDLLENQLLQYLTSGKEKKQRGPVIIALDNSGSMTGQPEIWAKSVAMGILEICRIQKRDLYVMHFDCGPKESIHCNFFPKNKYNLEEVIDMAEYFSGGGTEFEPVLDLAKDKIEEMKEFSKADILLVTDGQAPVSDKWLKAFKSWKKLKNVKVTSILIYVTENYADTVKDFSEEVVFLRSIRKDQADKLAISLFSGI